MKKAISLHRGCETNSTKISTIGIRHYTETKGIRLKFEKGNKDSKQVKRY